MTCVEHLAHAEQHSAKQKAPLELWIGGAGFRRHDPGSDGDLLVRGQGRVDLSDARDEAGALGLELLAAVFVGLRRRALPLSFAVTWDSFETIRKGADLRWLGAASSVGLRRCSVCSP
jgi:hypothetical protein